MKLGPRALKGNLVGYVKNPKTYGILDLSSNIIVESKGISLLKIYFKLVPMKMNKSIILKLK
jgi:hypothetical protein